MRKDGVRDGITAGMWALGAVFALDVVFIVLHLCVGDRLDVINLDQEGNLTSWWSSAKLLLAGGLAVAIWARERCPAAGRSGRRFTWLWLVVAAVFVLLSADETASLHERFARTVVRESEIGLDLRETLLGGDRLKDSFAWVLLLSPAIVGVAAFLGVFFHQRFRRSPAAYAAAIGGIVLFLAAAGMEATIYGTPGLHEWTAADRNRYERGLAVEESAEVFGASLFPLAFLLYLRRLRAGSVSAC